jgi:hypothetical protein
MALPGRRCFQGDGLESPSFMFLQNPLCFSVNVNQFLTCGGVIMNHLRQLALVMLFSSLFFVMPDPSAAQADDYWDNYWGWYDGTYQPYYSRRYYNDGYRNPRYYDRYYDGGYNDPYYGRGYYPYYRDYGTQRFGYQEYPSGGGAVRVGPLRFGWR